MKKKLLLFVRLGLYAILTISLLTGCKKVDDHAVMILSQPWLADSHTQTSGSRLTPITWTYPTDLLVGDTAMLIGRLFPYQPGTQIMIGGVPVKIIDTAQYSPGYRVYTPQPKMDGIQFIVTKEMTGPKKTVSITANGVTIYGNTINIVMTKGGLLRTDTTLWVDQLTQWLPANVEDYASHANPLMRSSHVDKAGNLYFDNKLSVQAINNGTVHTLIKAGDRLTDAKGSSFSIKQVLGSTVTFDGDAIYFSAEVSDNPTDEGTNYVFRLCKMDLTTKSISTLNRTLVANQYSSEETGGPFNGNISALKVVAVNLNTDINNNLYYTNVYAPGSPWDNHNEWYTSGISTGTTDYDSNTGSLLLVSRLDVNGIVHGLMHAEFYYPSTGFMVYSGKYLPDPSGKHLYGYTSVNWAPFELLQYNITDDDKGKTYKTNNIPYFFHSYEADLTYKNTSDFGFAVDPSYAGYMNKELQLQNGTLLVVNNHSLVNYDIEALSSYCYAGTEIGMYERGTPAQNKITGSAKWVNFQDVKLIGQDKNGDVYYCKGIDDYKNGVIFYKLHTKKN